MESYTPERSDDGYYLDNSETLDSTNTRELQRLNEADSKEIEIAQRKLEQLPRWQRMIPLFGRAAYLRHEIEELRRYISSRNQYWD